MIAQFLGMSHVYLDCYHRVTFSAVLLCNWAIFPSENRKKIALLFSPRQIPLYVTDLLYA